MNLKKISKILEDVMQLSSGNSILLEDYFKSIKDRDILLYGISTSYTGSGSWAIILSVMLKESSKEYGIFSGEIDGLFSKRYIIDQYLFNERYIESIEENVVYILPDELSEIYLSFDKPTLLGNNFITNYSISENNKDKETNVISRLGKRTSSNILYTGRHDSVSLIDEVLKKHTFIRISEASFINLLLAFKCEADPNPEVMDIYLGRFSEKYNLELEPLRLMFKIIE